MTARDHRPRGPQRPDEPTQPVSLLWVDSTPPSGAAILTPPGTPALPRPLAFSRALQRAAARALSRLRQAPGRASFHLHTHRGVDFGRRSARLLGRSLAWVLRAPRWSALAGGLSRRILTLTLAIGLAIVPGSLLLAVAALVWQRITAAAPLALPPPAAPMITTAQATPETLAKPEAAESTVTEAASETASELDRAVASLLPQASGTEPTPPLAETTSCSAGTRSRGPLQHPAALDDRGPGFRLLFPHRHLAYATDELVGALERVAASQAGTSAPPLMIGNLSGPAGSQAAQDPFHPAAYSSSHGAGRAVDLAFPVRDILGRPVAAAETHLAFDADGRSIAGIRRLYLDPSATVPAGCRRNRIQAGVAEVTCFSPEGAYTIDFDRSWKLLRALLLDPEIGVIDPRTGRARPDGTGIRFVFVAPALERGLLEAATRAKAPERLRQIARQLLHQPSNAAPFDHYLHLELWCTPADRATCGCDDGAPPWKRWRAGARVLDPSAPVTSSPRVAEEG